MPCGVTWVEGRPSPLDARATLEQIVSAGPDSLGEEPFLTSGERRVPSLTVGISTRERPEQLQQCLKALRETIGTRMDVPVIVADSGPITTRTREVVEQFVDAGLRIERIHVVRAGTSRGRNAIMRAATSDVVAFIDDDVRVPLGWLPAIEQAFVKWPSAEVVTGPMFPLELDSQVQIDFVRMMPWDAGLEEIAYNMAWSERFGPMFPYEAARFGSGATMAFRRQSLIDSGGFDVRLGPGTKTKGGEDLELFIRMVKQGRTLVTYPKAYVWHGHRSTTVDFEDQLFGYASGLSAFLIVLAIRGPGRWHMAKAVARRASGLLRERKDHSAESRGHVGKEFVGLCWGPLALLAESMGGQHEDQVLSESDSSTVGR
jgi:GT2 family glycosyltransferase